jgi:cobalt-zinc-cadmium efflux system outer membrane protein
VLSIARAGGWYAIIVMAVASFHAMACAEPTSPDTVAVVSGPLTLEHALALASRHELRLKASGLRAEAARARIGDASRLPNPILIASEENFGGGLGGSHREATLAIGQVFELGGDRGARRSAAEAEFRLATAESGLLGREARGVAAERFITAWSLQARIRRLVEAQLLTGQAIAAARARHRAGASPRLEVLRAETRAMAQAAERQRAESELNLARHELALSWGATEVTFDSLVAPDHAPAVPEAEWQARLQTHPELSRASATEAIAGARVQAALAARAPDLTLTAGVRRLEEVPGTGFLVGVELPLPLWNRGSGGVASARMELLASGAERRATEQRLQFTLAAATERIRLAGAAFDTLRLRVRPAREQLVDELLRGYRAGRVSYLDLVAEQGNLLETELALIDAEADAWRARLRLDQLVGTGPFAPKEER